MTEDRWNVKQVFSGSILGTWNAGGGSREQDEEQTDSKSTNRIAADAYLNGIANLRQVCLAGGENNMYNTNISTVLHCT